MQEVQQLPRGRHGLTREEVLSSQRGRMLVAMAEAVAANGYAGTSVAHVIKRARVSRETFYEHFSDKQDCFLAAHERGVEVLMGVIAEGLDTSATTPLERLDTMLRTYLGALAAHPEIARTFLVEVYAAGPQALQRRADQQERFIDALIATVGAETEDERFAVRMLVGGISSLVTTRVSLGRFDELTELHGPLLRLAAAALERR